MAGRRAPLAPSYEERPLWHAPPGAAPWCAGLAEGGALPGEADVVIVGGGYCAAAAAAFAARG